MFGGATLKTNRFRKFQIRDWFSKVCLGYFIFFTVLSVFLGFFFHVVFFLNLNFVLLFSSRPCILLVMVHDHDVVTLNVNIFYHP